MTRSPKRFRGSLRHVLAATAAAIAMLALLSATCGCSPSRDDSPSAPPTADGVGGVTPDATEDPRASDGLTDAESARIARAYREGSGNSEVAGMVPLATLGVSATELVVGDDTYEVAECYAVSSSASGLTSDAGADRGDVHVVYLAPDGLTAGYLGGYADLVR